MTRSSGYSIAAVCVAAFLPAAGGAATNASEPPLAAIVAAGPNATAAVLPDGTWRAELAALHPGDADPAVSPDGGRIAFVSERDGDTEIYVAEARTGEVRQLTRNERPDGKPAWSPNGRAIAWQSGSEGAANLFVMRSNGGGKRGLVGGPGDDVDPAWSPDGNRIAFSSTRSGRRQLWTVGARGGEPTLLAEIPGRARAPAWAPGGSRLAFARETAGGSEIWVLELSDGSTRRLTRGGWDTRPDWSPGGNHVAFARVRAGRLSIWVIGADGAPVSEVDGTDGLEDPDWAGTERSLVPRPDEHLPDLHQRTPAELAIIQEGRSFRLGFASSTENRGLGPLVIRGARRPGEPMRAHQVVELRGDGTRVVQDIGRMHYERHPPHFHWHLQSFVAYELRRADDLAVVVHDRKSGFCLIDRWGRASRRVMRSGPPRFTGDCGAGRRNARRVLEGTSVGYVDRYGPFFHGQDLDLTGLPAGRYVLVHRANPERRLRELSYSNDAASVLLELRWPNGRSAPPRFSILRRCSETERCLAR